MGSTKSLWSPNLVIPTEWPSSLCGNGISRNLVPSSAQLAACLGKACATACRLPSKFSTRFLAATEQEINAAYAVRNGPLFGNLFPNH